MIRIHKPHRPDILSMEGPRRRGQHSVDFHYHEADFRKTTRDRRKFTFDREIYGHESVKQALIDAQHKKCCFCESKLTHITSGDVEHFRPKAAVRDDGTAALTYPGYYWLAYDWDNLMLACELCNRRHKASLFPLLNPSDRVTSHRNAARLRREQPVFIKPDNEDPEALIDFRFGFPFARGDNRRARITIQALGLDRGELDEVRREHLSLVQTLLNILDGTHRDHDRRHIDLAKEASRQLARLTTPQAQYTAATRALLRRRISGALSFPLDPLALFKQLVTDQSRP